MIVLDLRIAVGIGSANTPLGHAIILIPIQLLLEQTGLSVNIISYSIFGFITGLIIFAALILIYRFLYRPDLSRMKGYDVSHLRKSLPAMDKKEKISAVLFVIVIAIWIIKAALKNLSFHSSWHQAECTWQCDSGYGCNCNSVHVESRWQTDYGL